MASKLIYRSLGAGPLIYLDKVDNSLIRDVSRYSVFMVKGVVKPEQISSNLCCFVAPTTMQSPGSEINRLCECGICHEGLRDAHICPECSNPFCRKCITQWLGRHHDCPVCRKQMNSQKLVKARIYEQVLECVNGSPVQGVKQVNCERHRGKQLSLFCWTCMECACVTCLFSKTHAKHKEEVVLMECASKKLKIRISRELVWIISRDREIAQAIGFHRENVTKLSAEKNRIFANIQQVLDAVKRQYDRECAKQQDKINLLEADKKSNTELRGIAEEWIKTEKIFELLPKIATLLKQDCFNSNLTNPKPVEKVNPNFKNDLIPELIELNIPVDDRKSSQIFKVECGFEFKVQLNPDGASFYTVALTIEKGIGGVYPAALGADLLVPINFGLHKATPMGRIRIDPAQPSVTIKVQLCKTYAEKCLLRQRYIAQLEKYVNSLKVSNQQQKATIESLSDKCNEQKENIQELVHELKTLRQNDQVAMTTLESGISELSESLRMKHGQLQESERLLAATREEQAALKSQLLEMTDICNALKDVFEDRLQKKTNAFDAMKQESNMQLNALRDQLQKKDHDFSELKQRAIKKIGGGVIVIICLIIYAFK